MYSTFEASDILSINRSRLVQWLDGEFINCDYVEWGRGQKASFKRYQLVNAGLFKVLVDVSISRSVAKYIVDKIGITSDKKLAHILRGKKKHKHGDPRGHADIIIDVSETARDVMRSARLTKEAKEK